MYSLYYKFTWHNGNKTCSNVPVINFISSEFCISLGIQNSTLFFTKCQIFVATDIEQGNHCKTLREKSLNFYFFRTTEPFKEKIDPTLQNIHFLCRNKNLRCPPWHNLTRLIRKEKKRFFLETTNFIESKQYLDYWMVYRVFFIDQQSKMAATTGQILTVDFYGKPLICLIVIFLQTSLK